MPTKVESDSFPSPTQSLLKMLHSTFLIRILNSCGAIILIIVLMIMVIMIMVMMMAKMMMTAMMMIILI